MSCYTPPFGISCPPNPCSPCGIPCIVKGPTGTTGSTGITGPQGPTGIKSFVIDHPNKNNKYLVHACLEGPEAGVYYRGNATIENEFIEITLPGYVNSLATDFTINITPIYDGIVKSPYTVSEVENGQFKIYGAPGRVFWTVYGKRFDINIEPDIQDVNVQGFGPYTWIN